MCVCVCFVCVCVCICARVLMCGRFGNVCTYIFCVFVFTSMSFILFRLCIFVLLCFVCTSEGLFSPRDNSIAVCNDNNNNNNNNGNLLEMIKYKITGLKISQLLTGILQKTSML